MINLKSPKEDYRYGKLCNSFKTGSGHEQHVSCGTIKTDEDLGGRNLAVFERKSPQSDAGIRDVPLMDSLAQVLRKHKGEKDELVFGDLKEYELTKGIQRYIKETGLSCTPHGLRHGFASILFKQGLDIKTIQYVLGHAQSSTTMEIYVHLLEQDKTAQALQALQNFMN